MGCSCVVTPAVKFTSRSEQVGPGGPLPKGLRKDLTGIWGLVWHHELDEDYRMCMKDNHQFDGGV